MFKLVIQDDEGKTTVVPLIRDEITIGRKEGNTIRLTERNVSRKHAKISRANGAVAIEDLGSYNGVKVNGTRILQKVTLSISDRVQIGDYLIELKAEGAEQPAQASYSDDARTQPIERLDPAALGALGLSPPLQPAQSQPMALADTDPARRAVQAAATATAPQTPARLVILSSNFPGREFALTKPTMVIGRTDDNDIVINHRSISRNHAQVVNEGGRFTIADLQSANGVRVNGEDYGKVELRRGDTVDLGHVRLRFVEPGEDFVFGRDAEVMDVPTAKKKTWLWALIGGVVVAGVVVVVVASGGGKKKGADQVASGSAATTGSGTGRTGVGPGTGDTVPAPSVVIDAAEAGAGAGTDMVAVGSGSGSAAVDTAAVKALIDEAKAAVDASDWAKAEEKAKAALATDPANEAAKALAEQASREKGNKEAFDDFNAAASGNPKNYDAAVKAFENITTDSVYKNQARGTYDQLHDEFVTSRVNYGKGLAKKKQCAELDKMANLAGNTFPDAKTAMNRIPCDDGADKPPVDKPPVDKPPVDKPPVDKPPIGTKTATELLNEAQAAASTNQYGRALSLAEQAMKAPGIDATLKSKAITLAGLAACNTKNAGKAKTYYGQSPAGRQTLLRQACLKQGIELAD